MNDHISKKKLVGLMDGYRESIDSWVEPMGL
jgi:hypothetical protein